MAEEPWYEMNKPEADRLYEEAVLGIKSAVAEGTPFEEAASAIEVPDEPLKAAIVADALKVIIAESHFAGKKPLGELAGELRLPTERLERTKAEMLGEVEQAAIEKYRRETGTEGQ